MSSEIRVLLTLLKYRRLMLEELSSLTSISTNVITEVLSKYKSYIREVGEEVYVASPVDLAFDLAMKGVELARLSELLNWKDFEEFSARILSEHGYETVRGLKLTTPVRLEVDVFGVEPVSRVGIAIDCKHWSSNSTSRLVEAATKHVERLNKLVKYYLHLKSKYSVLAKAKYIVPAIVTLFTPPIRIHDNVLVFSIREMPHVIRDLRAVIEEFEIKPVRLQQG